MREHLASSFRPQKAVLLWSILGTWVKLPKVHGGQGLAVEETLRPRREVPAGTCPSLA